MAAHADAANPRPSGRRLPFTLARVGAPTGAGPTRRRAATRSGHRPRAGGFLVAAAGEVRSPLPGAGSTAPADGSWSGRPHARMVGAAVVSTRSDQTCPTWICHARCSNRDRVQPGTSGGSVCPAVGDRPGHRRHHRTAALRPGGGVRCAARRVAEPQHPAGRRRRRRAGPNHRPSRPAPPAPTGRRPTASVPRPGTSTSPSPSPSPSSRRPRTPAGAPNGGRVRGHRDRKPVHHMARVASEATSGVGRAHHNHHHHNHHQREHRVRLER